MQATRQVAATGYAVRQTPEGGSAFQGTKINDATTNNATTNDATTNDATTNDATANCFTNYAKSENGHTAHDDAHITPVKGAMEAPKTTTKPKKRALSPAYKQGCCCPA